MAEDVTILLDEILAVKKPNGVKMNGYGAKSGMINGIIKKTDDVDLNDNQNGDVHTLRSPAGLLKVLELFTKVSYVIIHRPTNCVR